MGILSKQVMPRSDGPARIHEAGFRICIFPYCRVPHCFANFYYNLSIERELKSAFSIGSLSSAISSLGRFLGFALCGDPRMLKVSGGKASVMIYYDFRALLPINSSFVWLPDSDSDRVTITYSFPNSAPDYQYFRYGEVFANSFAPVSGFVEVQARRALQIWEEASAIDFIEVVNGPSDIVMGTYDFDLLSDPRLAAATAFAYYPAPVLDDYGLPGDIFFDFGAADNLGIWLHELGHALGLDHPFEGRILSPELDNGSYTIMSYNAITDKETIGALDIAAIQFLYGGPNSDPRPESSAMFRFLNTQTNVHFYTTNENERDAILTNAPHYKLEGAAFEVPETEGSLEVYRFYNVKDDVHFYTASETERDLVIETLSDLYQYEGQAFNAWENQDAPGEQAALHRFYRTDVGTHFYTASHDEFLYVRDNLHDFSYEGVAYYVDL